MTPEAILSLWAQFGPYLIPSNGWQNACSVHCSCVDFLEHNTGPEQVWCKHVAALFFSAAKICDQNASLESRRLEKAGAYHILKMRGIDLYDLVSQLQAPAAAVGSSVECPIEID